MTAAAEKVCAVCSSPLVGRHPGAVVCSDACRKVRQRVHRNNWGKRNRDSLNAAARSYREANARRYAEYSYINRYGVTYAEVEAMLSAQGGECAICKKGLRLDGVKGRDKAVVDHCHSTGVVRGLLCTPCNLMLGYAADRPETLSRAIRYLEPRQ